MHHLTLIIIIVYEKFVSLSTRSSSLSTFEVLLADVWREKKTALGHFRNYSIIYKKKSPVEVTSYIKKIERLEKPGL